jgi:hypothetical protein
MGSCGARPSPQELVDHYEELCTVNDEYFYKPLVSSIPNKYEIEWSIK